ncbi:MAG TPA: DUF5686 family protein [Bacteroidales bacterium]|nr:DUF5686 family protein [Bacteroidales bacterium]
MIRYFRYIFLLLWMIAIVPAIVFSQETRITGKITDARTGEPIPFVNVYFPNTTTGATSDAEGSYALITTHPGDSICASAVGYQLQMAPVQKGKIQTIHFVLTESTTTLHEIQVRPEERWVELLMKLVIKNKEKNNPDRIETYQCQVYNKIRIDINNVDPQLRERRIFKPIDFVFEHLDTSEIGQKVFLPSLISESVSDYYFRKSPRSTREVIKASRISGVENQSFTQYLGGLFLGMNVYDNYINVFDKNFVSPVAGFALFTYEYFLEDTVMVDGKTCYQIRFEPKRKQEMTFYGTLWIHDTTFAVKQIDMRVMPDANFNWVNDFYISQSYDQAGPYWTLTRDYRLVDLNPFKGDVIKTYGIFGHRSTIYSDYVFDNPKEDEFYTSAANVMIDPDAYRKEDSWWLVNRPDSLTDTEEQIYEMIDSVKNVPAYKYYEKAVLLLGTGYLVTGNFEIGPLYKFVSFNSIEGLRLRAGGRTSNKFSRKLMLEGHAAYGTKDRQWKYAAGMTYMVGKNPRRSVNLSYRYDMEQLGQDPNAFSEDNFFASFFRRSPADKLTMVSELKTSYEHEWFTGFSNAIRFIRREVYSLGDEKFIINKFGKQILDNSLVAGEIQLYTRFAYRERFLYGEFERTSLGTKYPVAELIYSYGIPGFAGSDVEYHRIQFKLKQRFNVANIGWSKYILEAGKTWGRLPYPFLKIHEGNETFFYYTESGNLMNYYEFISDRYASLFYIHHFDGWFLNKIPLMRKLKWREVVHGRAVWGAMTQENLHYSVLPANSGELRKPYFEVGTGIENIFKVGRIDAIWRLSHLDKPDAKRFAIFISVNFTF